MTAPSSPIRFACHQDLLILPVAIASLPKINTAAFPLRLLSLFDPSEPLFNQPGWHPLVIYHRVAVLIGRPYCVNVVMSEELGVRSKIRFFSALSASSAVKKSFI
jgi:hypothetical protein